MTEITLTRAQFDALARLSESLPDDATKRVTFENLAPAFVRVTFDAGYGTAAFDVDLDGNSDQVNFGVSGISQDAENYS
jgi:hypothetical protein